MAKAKKKDKETVYIWTEKAADVFGNRVTPGEPAHFMNKPVTVNNMPLSWLTFGYIKEGK